MDKLYDLMIMGFKYQVMNCLNGWDLIQITLNHLDAMKEIVNSTVAVKLVNNVINKLKEASENLHPHQLFSLKQEACAFFQDKKVKISIFLQENIQDSVGNMIVYHGGTLPTHTATPGTIRYYDSKGMVDREETLDLKNATGTTPAHPQIDPFKDSRTCKLGINMYRKGKQSDQPAQKTSGNDASASGSKSSGNLKAKSELNLLSSMIKSNDSGLDDTFKISNLFGKDDIR
jgi:hypothetical protein